MNSYNSKVHENQNENSLNVFGPLGFISPKEYYALLLESQREILQKEVEEALKKGRRKVYLSIAPCDELIPVIEQAGWFIGYDYGNGGNKVYYLGFSDNQVKSTKEKVEKTTCGGGCEVIG